MQRLTLLFIFFPFFLSAQSPYEIDRNKETWILGLGVATYLNGFILEKRLDPLSLDDILDLDRSSLSRFDRNATFKFSTKGDQVNDILLYSSFSLPLFFLQAHKSRNDFGKILTLYGETLLTTSGLTYLTKRLAKRARPFVYNELAAISDKQKVSARFSFFSRHTAVTASNCFFAAKVFSDYYPDSKLKPYVWVTASIVPALSGFFRVQAGKHFYSDVVVGYSLGAAVGFLIPHIHKVKKDKRISFYPAPTGIRITWNIR